MLPAVPEPEPLWQRRFRAPIVGFPTCSRHAPDRLVYASSESGVYQLHAWDRATGGKRQVTSEPVGLISGEVTPDGDWIVWHRDVTGDESGVWVATPFDGGTGASAEPLAAISVGAPYQFTEVDTVLIDEPGYKLGGDGYTNGHPDEPAIKLWNDGHHLT